MEKHEFFCPHEGYSITYLTSKGLKKNDLCNQFKP